MKTCETPRSLTRWHFIKKTSLKNKPFLKMIRSKNKRCASQHRASFCAIKTKIARGVIEIIAKNWFAHAVTLIISYPRVGHFKSRYFDSDCFWDFVFIMSNYPQEKKPNPTQITRWRPFLQKKSLFFSLSYPTQNYDRISLARTYMMAST